MVDNLSYKMALETAKRVKPTVDARRATMLKRAGEGASPAYKETVETLDLMLGMGAFTVAASLTDLAECVNEQEVRIAELEAELQLANKTVEKLEAYIAEIKRGKYLLETTDFVFDEEDKSAMWDWMLFESDWRYISGGGGYDTEEEARALGQAFLENLIMNGSEE